MRSNRSMQLVGAGMLAGLLVGCGNAPTEPGAALSVSGSDGQSVSVDIRDLSELKVGGESAAVSEAQALGEGQRVYDVDTLSAGETYALYLGYNGPWFSQLEYEEGARVLQKSVFVEDSAEWSANLLVRNDSLKDSGAIVVTAQLLDSGGELIGTANGISPVSNARPGEPVPVHLSSQVPATKVSEVRYSAALSDADPVVRGIELTTIRSWPYGNREPIVAPGISEKGLEGTPLPAVDLIYANNVTSDNVVDFSVTVAWMNDRGQIVHIAEAKPVSGEQTNGGGADMLVLIDSAAIAKQTESLQQLQWGVGA